MPWAVVENLFRELSKWEHPLEELVPVNYGELLCYPYWYELLRLAENLLPATTIVLPLNGAMLDEKSWARLVSVRTLKVLNFSVNAYFGETYENFTGLPKETLPLIRGCIYKTRVRRPDILIRVSMVFDPEYQTDLERDLFINYWKDVADVAVIPAASCGRPSKRPIKPVKLPCRSIFSDFVIGFDGKLSSCCFDSGFVLDLGRYSGSILKDWRNPKIEELRRKHNEKRREEIPTCRSCTFA